jgi:5-methylcytosine-specific restriction endonuclease McrA
MWFSFVRRIFYEEESVMNHKWENDRCVRCGVERKEIKSEDHNGHNVTVYQYTYDRKNWLVKRPDCYEAVESKTLNGSSFSIKKLIEQECGNKSRLQPISHNTVNKSYSELLKDPRWQKRRLEIMQRDDFECKHCGNNINTLNVHHKYYIHNRAPWEYSDDVLITLCESCHIEFEANKSIINDFTKVLLCNGWTPMDLDNLLYTLLPLSNWLPHMPTILRRGINQYMSENFGVSFMFDNVQNMKNVYQ